MPLGIRCEKCQESHLIRDDLIGSRIKCACGRVQVVPKNAPRMPAPRRSVLDSVMLRRISVALLIVSGLVCCSIVTWTSLDPIREDRQTAVARDKSPLEPPVDKPVDRPLKPEVPKEDKIEKNEPPGNPTFTQEQLHNRLLHSVVWIYGSNKDGAWTGSGGVIHVGKRLIITNAHVVENESRVKVLFPRYDKQEQLINDKNYYRELLQNGDAQSALVLARDAVRDLAVIQLESPLPQNTIAIKVAPRPAHQAEALLSVGNPGPSNALWVPSPGRAHALQSA